MGTRGGKSLRLLRHRRWSTPISSRVRRESRGGRRATRWGCRPPDLGTSFGSPIASSEAQTCGLEDLLDEMINITQTWVTLLCCLSGSGKARCRLSDRQGLTGSLRNRKAVPYKPGRGETHSCCHGIEAIYHDRAMAQGERVALSCIVLCRIVVFRARCRCRYCVMNGVVCGWLWCRPCLPCAALCNSGVERAAAANGLGSSGREDDCAWKRLTC